MQRDVLDILRKIVSEELSKALSTVKHRGDLLTRKEAADYLGIKENTLAVWAVRGINIAPIKVGSRCVRYRQADLDAFVAKNTMPRGNGHGR